MRKVMAAMVVGLVLVVPATAAAFGSATGQNVSVDKGQTRSGTYFEAGQNVTMAGTIDGDLVCAGSVVKITGTVHGDVLCAGQNVEISGTVDGSVRVAGQTISLSGVISRNLMAIGQSVSTAASTQIAGDSGIFAQTATLAGSLVKQVYGGAQSLTIDGQTGPLAADVESLVLGSAARVNGDLIYKSGNQANLDDAKVTGTVSFNKRVTTKSQPDAAGLILERLFWIANYIVIAFGLIIICPQVLRRVTHLMRQKPAAAIGWGSLAALATPSLMIVLALTIVGVGLMLYVAAAWVAALMLGSVFAGTALGLWALEKADWRAGSLWWAALVGIFGVMVIMSVPWVGGVVSILVAVWSLGGMIIGITQARKSAS